MHQSRSELYRQRLGEGILCFTRSRLYGHLHV